MNCCDLLSAFLRSDQSLATRHKGDVIPGLTDGLVAIKASALLENSPHVVCGRGAQLTSRSLAPLVRRRLGPHHLRPPQCVCSSCPSFFNDFGVCDYTCMRVCASFELFLVGMTDRFPSLVIAVSSAFLVCRWPFLHVPSRVPSTSYVSACA